MPNPDDFDPAEAIRQQRAAEEAEKQRALSWHNNILKLLRYADEQLEEIRNPVVSEFVVTERWSTKESKQISDKRVQKDFEKTLRADQTIISCDHVGSFFRPRCIYTVVTSHQHQRQTRYYGSWLSLDCTSGSSSYRRGLVKLRQPRAGYVHVQINGWDPRNVGHYGVELTDYRCFVVSGHRGRALCPKTPTQAALLAAVVGACR